ncbi:MAG: polysaccharide deacetylase family protein [Pirellulales bacterium]|nr:polysaccharide deacetylase family protein [Pirellulales bacterium]
MSHWKPLLLHLYYYGSYPLRRRYLRQAVAAGRVPMAVLFYHRVADDQANEWTLSHRMFARQIRWLRSRFELISLQEVQRRMHLGTNRRPCVSITFDDGYADNCREAIPLLIKQRIPCTYFVATENVLHGRPFPHDAALGRPLEPNTLEELRVMADAGIEIGAHTYTHADLGRIDDPQQLRREVITAGEDLRAALERPVRYFAFPIGHHANLSRAAFDLAYGAGYLAACSAYGGFNFPGDDPFHVQRIAADETMIRLKNWTTLDPRKLGTPRFAYEPPAVGQVSSQSAVAGDAKPAREGCP